MPSIFSHAIVAVTLGKFYPARKVPARFWVLAAICAALPDIDVIGFAFGIPYGALFGHRGLTHSLLFAAVLSDQMDLDSCGGSRGLSLIVSKAHD